MDLFDLFAVLRGQALLWGRPLTRRPARATQGGGGAARFCPGADLGAAWGAGDGTESPPR